MQLSKVLFVNHLVHLYARWIEDCITVDVQKLHEEFWLRHKIFFLNLRETEGKVTIKWILDVDHSFRLRKPVNVQPHFEVANLSEPD